MAFVLFSSTVLMLRMTSNSCLIQDQIQGNGQIEDMMRNEVFSKLCMGVMEIMKNTDNMLLLYAYVLGQVLLVKILLKYSTSNLDSYAPGKMHSSYR